MSELGAGENAKIVEVQGTGPLRRRLLELGVLPGTWLKVERIAPLGDPAEIRLRGYSLSLRRSETSHIRVSRV